MNFIATRKIWYSVSVIAIGLSFLALAVWGLKLGIDFTGGSLVEYAITPTPSVAEFRPVLDAQKLEGVTVVQTDRGILLRSADIPDAKHTLLTAAVQKQFTGAEELRFESIGPAIGAELRGKATTAVVLTLVLILCYVAYAFRKVSGRIQAWKYGALVVLSGLHDAIIPIGVFAVLGRFWGVEVNGPFIAAILTILGYSINDTIVVFDRIRENMLRTSGTVAEIVEASIKQTYVRSINTTLTTLLALLAIFFFGGDSTKEFALALIIGIATGAYSSIFIASPLLVSWQKK